MRDKIKHFAVTNSFTYHIIYICYLVYAKVISLLYLLMRVKPIDEKKIVFCTMKGRRYGDNPMYISDELLKRDRGYKIVWLLQDDVNENIPDGVTRRRYSSFSIIRELATAKVWVDSNMKDFGFLKRKGQYYFQTWHGSYGIKKIGGDLEDKMSLIDRKIYKYNSDRTDLMLSNSRQTTEIYRRAFWYNGEMLEYGSPRNDIFFDENGWCRKKVEEYFRLGDMKIALYAPTYRNNYRTDDFKLDYERLMESLSQRFGGEWAVLVRLHPNNLAEAKDFITYTDRLLNASAYSIMQELLVASDVLITDYSSCMLDFATTKKPCFLYAADVERYKEERDSYFELDELPFPLAQDNDQMEKAIASFDERKYQEELELLFKRVGLNETGKASEKAADYIEEWMGMK